MRGTLLARRLVHHCPRNRQRRTLSLFPAINTHSRYRHGALALMHPDVTWPNGWEGGWVQGKGALPSIFAPKNWRPLSLASASRTDEYLVPILQLTDWDASTLEFQSNVQASTNSHFANEL